MINDKKVSKKLVPNGPNRLQVNNNNNNANNNAKCNDTAVGAVKKSKSMIRKSMITNNKNDSMLLSLNKQEQKQHQLQHQQQQQQPPPQQPIIVSEIKARYRFGSKSNNYSTNWLKGNIPVIKFKPIEENVILDHTITQSSSRKCSSNKKIKFNNNNNNDSNLIFKSATIDEVSLLKPLRKKHLSSKSSINVSKRHNQAPPKVVSVAGTKQPPPPKTLTSKSVNLPTGKLVHYKSCPIQLVQPTVTTTPCLQMPTFPPFCIKLQFKL